VTGKGMPCPTAQFSTHTQQPSSALTLNIPVEHSHSTGRPKKGTDLLRQPSTHTQQVGQRVSETHSHRPLTLNKLDKGCNRLTETAHSSSSLDTLPVALKYMTRTTAQSALTLNRSDKGCKV